MRPEDFLLEEIPHHIRNNIEYVTISTLGNSQDFGDLLYQNTHIHDGGCSNAHGGL